MCIRDSIKAVKKGLFKIMAKMGISTIRSYRGAKIFESIGLSESLLKSYFGTEVSTIGGIGLETIARDAIRLHDKAFETKKLEFLPSMGPVSYTHLDVYKRQLWSSCLELVHQLCRQ